MIAVTPQNGHSDEHFRRLDMSGLSFPSDKISIEMLRRHHPASFDVGFGSGKEAQPKFFFIPEKTDHAESVLANMLFCERLVAASAYADARGIDRPEDELDEFKEELVELYLRYQLATGKHHAAELIRDIERQGAALAPKIGL